MYRRDLLKLVLGLSVSASFAGTAFAQESEKPSSSKLPFKRVSVKGDESKVVFFFDFSCQFSANYHLPMLNWERTLPRGPNIPKVTVDFVPLVNMQDMRRRNDMALAAAGYYAAVSLSSDRNQLKNFIEALYDARLRDGQSFSSSSMWAYACKKSGLNLQKFLREAAGINKSILANAARRLELYKISTTPSVGIAGQFVLTPDDVNGDQELFFNLLNGLASNYLLS